MKRILYLTPAVVVCLFYGLMAILVGGIGGFQPIALLYAGLPVLASILLVKGKWWGCLPGIALGAVLLYMSGQHTGQALDIEQPLGMFFTVYYAVMGIVCLRSRK